MDSGLGYAVHIADTEKKAIEEARPYFEEDMKMFGPLGVGRNLSDEQIAALTDPSKVHSGVLPTLEMAVEGGGRLCGPPELITEKIMEIQERYPGLEAMKYWIGDRRPRKGTLGATRVVRQRGHAQIQRQGRSTSYSG